MTHFKNIGFNYYEHSFFAEMLCRKLQDRNFPSLIAIQTKMYLKIFLIVTIY